MANGFNITLLVLSVIALIGSVESTPVFYETFEESWEGRWITSEKDEYQGKWKHEKSEGHEDYGLLVSEKARKYGIAVNLPHPIELKHNTVVLQYDTRLQNGLECGGAYLKFLLPQEAGWTPNLFDNDSPYSIMFGPDKCGATNKVHFIFRHKHPKTRKYIEHHLKFPPTPLNDKLSHVYTAVIYPNNTLKLSIDGQAKKTVDLLSTDFEPPVLPPKTIPDPDDKKPEDWDENPKIPDPEAKKPDDWDDDAPMEIEDLEAEKPEGWLDDEPEEINDPEAVKPEDWDDDEDGEWEAPKITNPKCEEAPGCGEWKRPTKRNPAYKGKWHPPTIDNPAYKGVWKPQQIPNPDYFELESPNLEPIAAIGIEIWTMQDGILFDNILITTDEAEAEDIRVKSWKVKFEAEKEKEKLEEQVKDVSKAGVLNRIKEKTFKLLRGVADFHVLAAYRPKLIEIIEKGEDNSNITLGILVSLVLVFLTTVYKLTFGRRQATSTVPVEIAKNEVTMAPTNNASSGSTKDELADAATENENENDESEPTEEIGEEASGTRHRRPRRET